MRAEPDADPFIVGCIERVGEIALALPETYEEDAWVGVRWRIRQRTFAHVAPVDGSSPAIDLAAASGGFTGGSAIMTFRSAGAELSALVGTGHPFFKPVWSPNVVGVHLSPTTDWRELSELITDSYRLLAPKKLAALIPD